MKSKKDKHKGKDKHKKHKKSRKSSRADRGSSSGSDSDAPRDVNAELERSRMAARAMREILGHDYSLRADLREVVSKLDRGEALSVDGVQDRYVRSRLHTMLSNLPQVRATPSVRAAGGWLLGSWDRRLVGCGALAGSRSVRLEGGDGVESLVA